MEVWLVALVSASEPPAHPPAAPAVRAYELVWFVERESRILTCAGVTRGVGRGASKPPVTSFSEATDAWWPGVFEERLFLAASLRF